MNLIQFIYYSKCSMLLVYRSMWDPKLQIPRQHTKTAPGWWILHGITIPGYRLLTSLQGTRWLFPEIEIKESKSVGLEKKDALNWARWRVGIWEIAVREGVNPATPVYGDKHGSKLDWWWWWWKLQCSHYLNCNMLETIPFTFTHTCIPCPYKEVSALLLHHPCHS